jgi:hypothetical protein
MGWRRRGGGGGGRGRGRGDECGVEGEGDFHHHGGTKHEEVLWKGETWFWKADVGGLCDTANLGEGSG